MRTEDDLRQALATLQRHARSADTVLAGVRAAAGDGVGPGALSRIRRWRPPAAHRWWRGPGWPWPWPPRRRSPDW